MISMLIINISNSSKKSFLIYLHIIISLHGILKKNLHLFKDLWICFPDCLNFMAIMYSMYNTLRTDGSTHASVAIILDNFIRMVLTHLHHRLLSIELRLRCLGRWRFLSSMLLLITTLLWISGSCWRSHRLDFKLIHGVFEIMGMIISRVIITNFIVLLLLRNRPRSVTHCLRRKSLIIMLSHLHSLAGHLDSSNRIILNKRIVLHIQKFLCWCGIQNCCGFTYITNYWLKLTSLFLFKITTRALKTQIMITC